MAKKKNKPRADRPTAPTAPTGNPGEAAAAAVAPSENRRRAFARAGFFAVLVVCLAWILCHAWFVYRVTVRLCDQSDAGIPVEARLPVFLSEIAFDGYVWNRHAEALGTNGEWRVRHTDLDNHPHGREVHWNSAFAWYLRGLGEIRRAVTGESLRHAIFRMSIWANPILLVLAVGIFSTLSARRFGYLCGAVIALGMVAVPTFYEGFLPAYPDHHGLIAFALLGLVFGIAWAGAGWVRAGDSGDLAPPATLAQARHGMIFSAVCGAAGLWISALSTAIVLGTVGAGALAAAAFYARSGRKGGAEFHPELWKCWAKWGSGMALFFYLLEYFPFEMGMRMEVNHPLYALAFLGGGWIIAEVAGWLRAPTLATFPWKKLVLPVAACAVLPAVIVLGGPEVYIPKDGFMGRLWKNIAELLPLITRIKLGGLTWGVAIGWFPVFLLAALALQFPRRIGRGTKATLLFLVVPVLLITGLQFYQVRWGMLTGPLYIALAGVLVPQIWALVPKKGSAPWTVGIVLAALGFVFVEPAFRNSFGIAWTQFRSGEKIAITPGQGLALLHRKMARAILDDAGGKPVVLLSSPNSSCLLSALGGFQTVGTLYWENVDGLKAAAAALNAQSDAGALEMLGKLGITHVSLMTWENFIGPYFGLLHPKPAPGLSYENSFGKRALFDKVIPQWTSPVVFPKNEISNALKQEVLLLRVAPGQPDEEARTRLARFVRIVEGNPVAAEISLKSIMEKYPAYAPARIELALLRADQKNFDEAAALALEAIRNLPESERANASAGFSSLFRSAGREDLAAKFSGPAQ